jgi:tyrosine-protein kinase Etk/Wzc
LGFLNDKLQTTRALLKKSEVTLNHYREQNGEYGIKYTAGLYLEQLKVLGKELSSLHIKKTNMLKNYTLEHPIQKDMDIQTRFIEAQRNQLEKKLKILSASDQIIDNLTRDLSIKKELYLNLLNKIQNLKVVKKNATSNIQIISPASFSDVLVPSKGKIYLGSILLGLILSVIIVLGRKLLSRRVEDPGWADKNFNLENLAIIPYSIEQRQNTLKFRGQNCREMRLLAHTNPRHIAIESLRGLRTSLQVASICASNNCISILSVVPGVGKSFVSANLAYLLAISGKRVLLIDGDLRQGNLHHYMNVPSLPGLTEVICKTAAIEDALSETINKNLFFLPRGAITSDPSALLMSEHFKTLMINFSEQYDVVIIDTTPMLLVTDAVLISSVAATNYLVLGAGAHQPREIEQVLHRLGKYGVRLNGSIFNFYSPETFLKSHGQYGKHAKKSLYYKHCHAELMKH